MGFHNAAPHSCERPEIIEALDLFRESFGHDPVTMSNHFNEDAVYWGPRVWMGSIATCIRCSPSGGRVTHTLATCPAIRHSGATFAAPAFVIAATLFCPDIATLSLLPAMPYYDPRRPYVRAWYTPTDGHHCPQFLKAISETRQNQLEASGGACIICTHFGHYFVVNDKLSSTFQRLIKRLAAELGYFVATGTLLQYLEDSY